MILPGIEILRGGHGKYNLRSPNVFSCNIAELSFCGPPLSFQTGRSSLVRR